MKAGKAEPVKLVISVFSPEPELIETVLGELRGRFGNIDLLSEPLEFDSTRYYEDEFGSGLVRRVASFEDLIEPVELPGIKLETNGLEETYVGPGGKRRVNIDPGYLTLERLVLASCKNFSHRVCLGEGVYADLTLVYRRGEYRTLEWTYPDYGGPRMRGLFKEIRAIYAKKIGRGTGGRQRR